MAPSATSPPLTSTASPSDSIPLIPLPPLLDASPTPLTHSTSTLLLTALRTSGFLYLTSVSALIPPSLLARVFTLSGEFFALPQARKDDVAWTTARANRGYVKLGREKVSRGKTGEEVQRDRAEGGEDMKESFEIGREGEEGYENRWVGGEGGSDGDEGFDGEEFREVMQEFFERGKELHAVVMRGIALALGLERDFFEGFLRKGDNTLRLLHYPPLGPGAFKNGRVRAGTHSDYGSVTFLFQDGRGGLQVESPSADGEGKFVDVEPREGCVVVNAGDLLARWSSGLVRSTKHRVVEPPLGVEGGKGGYPPRYSVAYFGNPDFDRWIEALPGTWEGQKGGKKWEGINSGEYLVGRLSATYQVGDPE